MLRPRGFSQIGLPKGHSVLALAYHYGTSTLIAHTRPGKRSLPSERLSLRRVNDGRYRLVAKFPKTISISSFAFSGEQPLLYFITQALSVFRGSGPLRVFKGTKLVAVAKAGVGRDWDALYRLNLTDLRCELLARPGTLVPPEGYSEAWLSTLLSVRDDGQTLFVIAALQKSFDKPGALVDYYLAELRVADMKLIPMSELKAIFA